MRLGKHTLGRIPVNHFGDFDHPQFPLRLAAARLLLRERDVFLVGTPLG